MKFTFSNFLNFYIFNLAVVFPIFFSEVVFAESSPKVFTASNSFDFGTVRQGATVNQAFTIENKGDEALKILDVQADCGCTVAEPESREIPPGGSSKINVVFDTAGFRGFKVKSIRVYNNDATNNPLSLKLKGNIQRDIEVEPARLFFGTSKKGKSLRQEVKFQKFSSDDIKINEITPSSNLIKVKRRSGGFDVELSDQIPFGVFREKIIIKTTSSETPVIHLPVFAKIRGDITAKPADVSFGLLKAPLSQDVFRQVTISNSSGQPVKVLEVESSIKGVSASIDTPTLNDKSKLTVKLESGLKGVLHGEIKIKTNHKDPEQQTLKVPFYAVVAKKGA